jgi:ABC-type histidine transport system ATPase subunit
MISGFHLKVDEICALLGNYVVFSGTSLQAFPGHPICLLKVVGCPKTVVKNCHCTALQNFPECRSLIMNAPILSSKCVVTTQMFAKNRRVQ